MKKTYIKPFIEQVSLSLEMMLTVSLPFDKTEHGKAEAFPHRDNWGFFWENSF